MDGMTRETGADDDVWRDLVAAGPDTTGGKFLRRFWQPVALSSEIETGRARPLHILDEMFTLYCGESGQPHVVSFRCSHRSTQLSNGWVRGEDLQCMYHGWTFDGGGHCIARPGEKDPGAFPQADIKGYPTREFLGLIYAYFGDGEPPPFPPIPAYKYPGVIENHGMIFPCNWFQTMENHFDETHIAFVHSFGNSHDDLGRRYELPEMDIHETDYGMIRKTRVSGGDWRTTHYLMPNVMRIMIPTFNDLMVHGGWRDTYIIIVPTDDANHRLFFTMNVHIPDEEMDAYHRTNDDFAARVAAAPPVHELAHEVNAGRSHLTDHLDHPHLLILEDAITQAGQGQITDRRTETLGRTDVGVAAMRKVYRREMAALAAGQPLTDWAPMTVEPERGF